MTTSEISTWGYAMNGFKGEPKIKQWDKLMWITCCRTFQIRFAKLLSRLWWHHSSLCDAFRTSSFFVFDRGSLSWTQKSTKRVTRNELKRNVTQAPRQLVLVLKPTVDGGKKQGTSVERKGCQTVETAGRRYRDWKWFFRETSTLGGEQDVLQPPEAHRCLVLGAWWASLQGRLEIVPTSKAQKSLKGNKLGFSLRNTGKHIFQKNRSGFHFLQVFSFPSQCVVDISSRGVSVSAL